MTNKSSSACKQPHNSCPPLTSQFSGRSIIIAPRAGASAAGVAYGVVIRSAQAPSGEIDASQLASDIVRSLRSADPNMKQVGEVQRITVSGNLAASTELETMSPMAGPDGNAQRERDWLVAVARGRTALFLVFVSPLSDFDRLHPAFERMLDGVSF